MLSGFTSHNLPSGYTSLDQLSRGLCGLSIVSPSALDHHPWTVVARIVGQDVEVSDTTDHTLEMPPVPVPDPSQPAPRCE